MHGPPTRVGLSREGTLKWRAAIRSWRVLPAFSTGAPWHLQVWHLQACALPARSAADHGPGHGFARLGIGPEMSPAGRRELGLFGDHARRHTADIGNCGAAEAERVAACRPAPVRACRPWPRQATSRPRAPLPATIQTENFRSGKASSIPHPDELQKLWMNAGDSQARVSHTPRSKCRGSSGGNSASEGVVQLGGLEPPTSCSTDRRSNQLSYNCILREGPSEGGREWAGN